MKTLARLYLLFMAVFIFVVLHNTAMAEELSGKLVISGSDAMEPLTVDLAKRFMKLHKNVKIIVRGGESSMGISETRSGTAAIGMVSRPLSNQEATDFRSVTVAYEGVCFITSMKNPVHDLSSALLKEIFLGKSVNWKSVGGDNVPINSLIPYRKSASNKIVAEFLGVQVADLKGTEVSDFETGIEMVSKDPKAIFYVSTGKAFSEKLSGRSFNILSVSGKKASMASISRNRYPLTRTLSFITLGEPDKLAKEFISYCLSPAAANTIRSHYLIKPE